MPQNYVWKVIPCKNVFLRLNFHISKNKTSNIQKLDFFFNFKFYIFCKNKLFLERKYKTEVRLHAKKVRLKLHFLVSKALFFFLNFVGKTK